MVRPVGSAGCQGTEHSAEIIAWGLAEESYPLVRVPHAERETSIEAFRLLTGAEPMHGC